MELLTFFFFVLLFMLGAAMGSFAGVILERSKEGFARKDWASIFGGRSYCPGCKRTLSSWQLIPIVGWLIQEGTCKDCDAPIPSWYLLIEIIMGTVFVGTFIALVGTDVTVLIDQISEHNWRYLVRVLFWLLVNWGLASLLLADLSWYVLNMYVWLLTGAIVSVLLPLGWPGLVLPAALSAVLFGAVFFALYLFGRWRVKQRYNQSGEGIGLGDVVMSVIIGLLTVFWPYQGVIEFLQLVCWFLIVSSLIGMLYRFLRSVFSGSKEQTLPFLPAMIVAYYLLLLRGGKLLDLVEIIAI